MRYLWLGCVAAIACNSDPAGDAAIAQASADFGCEDGRIVVVETRYTRTPSEDPVRVFLRACNIPVVYDCWLRARYTWVCGGGANG